MTLLVAGRVVLGGWCLVLAQRALLGSFGRPRQHCGTGLSRIGNLVLHRSLGLSGLDTFTHPSFSLSQSFLAFINDTGAWVYRISTLHRLLVYQVFLLRRIVLLPFPWTLSALLLATWSTQYRHLTRHPGSTQSR